MSSIADMLDKCRSYLGYLEDPPGSNNTIFGQWYGIPDGAWCDMFLSYCAYFTGNADAVGKFAWTVSHAGWFAGNNQWDQTPSVGALVFFDWGGSKLISKIDHVGIVEAVNDDGSITTIEGNTEDTCARRIRRANIVGYGHPAYQEVAMRTMFDAAYPPGTPPKVDAVAGYIGGNTPHIWTDAEWDSQMTKSGAKYKLPIFVRSHDGVPADDAAFTLRWLQAHNVPKGSLVVLDFETRVDATYLHTYDSGVVGYPVIVYGSHDYVIQNPKPSGGYWTATWNNIPHLDVGATITQYGGDTTLGVPYDLNVVADNAPLWGGTVTPGVFMALTDAEQAEVLKAARQVNAAVGSGQASYETTIEAILATAQALVNEGRSQAGSINNNIVAARDRILGSRLADLTDVLGKVEGNYNAVGDVKATLSLLVDSSRAEVLTAIANIPSTGGGGATPEQVADAVLLALKAAIASKVT